MRKYDPTINAEKIELIYDDEVKNNNIIIKVIISILTIWLVIDFIRFSFGKESLNLFGALQNIANNPLLIDIPLQIPNIAVDYNNIFISWILSNINLVLNAINLVLWVLQAFYNMLMFILTYLTLLLFT